MSQCQYDGQRWSTKSSVFLTADQQHGALQVRHGLNMGGTWAFALLGPDLKRADGVGNNPPTADAIGYNLPWTGVNRPQFQIIQEQLGFIRGHMINGEWHGSGSDWKNLTPLSDVANKNHSTIENSVIKHFLTKSLAYEENGNRTHWYGVEYLVQCATNSLDYYNSRDSVHAYVPSFIKLTWRAVRIQKPTHTPINQITNAQITGSPRENVDNLPFALDINQNYIGGGCLPAHIDNNAGGAVNNTNIPNLVQPRSNGFDGSIEIHQT